eukprot:evm.model.scf_4207.1 EVM.evm.TU.scf_4207.1   scf_4207:158-2651(-)
MARASAAFGSSAPRFPREPGWALKLRQGRAKAQMPKKSGGKALVPIKADLPSLPTRIPIEAPMAAPQGEAEGKASLKSPDGDADQGASIARMEKEVAAHAHAMRIMAANIRALNVDNEAYKERIRNIERI